MKNSKYLLVGMLVCGSILFGCDNANEVKKVEEPKQEQQVESTEEINEQENSIWNNEEIRKYKQLQTENIKLIKVNENEVKMLYIGSILDYLNNVNKEVAGDSEDFELTTQLLGIGLHSISEPEKTFTLVDNKGIIIYSYTNGEPAVNGLENLR